MAKTLDEGSGKLEALNPRNTALKTKRIRIIPKEVENLIFKEHYQKTALVF